MVVLAPPESVRVVDAVYAWYVIAGAGKKIFFIKSESVVDAVPKAVVVEIFPKARVIGCPA